MVLGNNYGMHLMDSGVEISMIPFIAINKHWLLPLLFVILMTMFYITSSDSQSFAMDRLISKGSKTPPTYRKILWVFLEVLFVAVLLFAGSNSVSALQGLSFLFVPAMILFAIIYFILLIVKWIKLYKNS
jgi:choline-glycine betaine transporter